MFLQFYVFNYRNLRKISYGCESGLKQVRHIHDNKTGFTMHAATMAASDIHLVSEFKYEQHVTLIDYFDDIMCALFNQKKLQKPISTGKLTLSIDHGYSRIVVFWWGLEIGRDFLATSMRNLGLYPFLFGKKTRNMSAMTGMRRNLNLSLLAVSKLCTKKAHDNLGHGSPKDKALISIA